VSDATKVRFLAKVNVNGPVPAHRPELGPCHVWTASLTSTGYGQFFTGSRTDGSARMAKAPRVAWELAYGATPAGLWVLHACDNPKCVRIDHLFLGTHDDNIADMIAKGRLVVPRGERSGQAKLTEAAVLEIRATYTAGKGLMAISERFGVSKSTILRIASRRSWKHAGGACRRSAEAMR